MRWIVFTGLVAAAMMPAAAQAQETADCGPRLDEVAARVPDLSETPDAPERLGLEEEQLEGVLATLDAARIVRDVDPEGCVTLVEAAASILDRGRSDR